MARPIRILFKGAYYHVINRGHRKEKIYLEDADYNKFIKIAKEACEKKVVGSNLSSRVKP